MGRPLSLHRFRPPPPFIGLTKIKKIPFVIISYFVGSDGEDNDDDDDDEVNTPRGRASRRLPGKSPFSDCKRNFKW